MRLHILGICGTFMSGLALLAKQLGHEVTGSDLNVYPPMSTQLNDQGIQLMNGYEASHVSSNVDLVIVGNVVKRGNPAMEYLLDNGIAYMSGPEWLSQFVLKNRWVLGVAGTHGKTTTTSILTWILESAGLSPGFLIGGVPENFGVSARLGNQPYFVIEADEYDSAFFDKRSKFIHYHPKTTILNNLEFDHADIFSDLEAIKQQFHHLIKTLPGNGLIISNSNEDNLKDVLSRGVWTPVTTFSGSGEWQAKLIKPDGSQFSVFYQAKHCGDVTWSLVGQHNVDNALAAMAAAHHVGVDPSVAISALSSFKNVKRRLEEKGRVNGIVVYDDFAHHPTAIETTLAGLRAKIGKARLIAVLEWGSYTMRSGVHKPERVAKAMRDADKVICLRPKIDMGLEKIKNMETYDSVEAIVENLTPQLKAGDHILIMSNSGFGGIHTKLLDALSGVKV